MATYLILAVIILYSAWMIYKLVKSKLKGECNSCSGCSLNGSCPAQALKKPNEEPLKLNIK